MVDLFLGLDSSSSVSTRVPPDDICQGLDTPLVNPRILATVIADADGDASYDFTIPQNAGGAVVYVQAVDLTTCTGSNVNQETITNPPAAPPVLDPMNPGTAGVQNTISVTGATSKCYT